MLTIIVVSNYLFGILQCLKWQVKRTGMMNAVEKIPDGSGRALLNSQCDMVIALLEGLEDTFTYEKKVVILSISADYISIVYYEKVKEGIG